MIAYFFLLFFLAGLGAIIVLIGACQEKFKNKVLNIVLISLVLAIVLHIIALVAIKNTDQKNFENAYTIELEKTISDFKSEHPDVIKSITYKATFNGGEDVNVTFYVEANQTEKYVSYSSLFLIPLVKHYDTLFGISMYPQTYGRVYVNGELKEQNSAITSTGSRCPICNKSYTSDSDIKSINKTNMCSQCYKNYKYASN